MGRKAFWLLAPILLGLAELALMSCAHKTNSGSDGNSADDDSVEVNVPANQAGGTPTGLSGSAGDWLDISATGAIDLGDRGHHVPPVGVSPLCGQGCPMPAINLGALLARVVPPLAGNGALRPLDLGACTFAVGAHFSGPLPCSGSLTLLVNDNAYTGNSGSFQVVASLTSRADDDASSDDDDNNNDDSGDDTTTGPFSLTATVGGVLPPVTLLANAAYGFAFDVFNTAGGSEAIQSVEIAMPSVSYVVETGALVPPTALHAGRGAWRVSYESSTITWWFEGVVTAVSAGDIDQGEELTFPFVATTDAVATDGFAWRLTGDASTTVSGIFYFE